MTCHKFESSCSWSSETQARVETRRTNSCPLDFLDIPTQSLHCPMQTADTGLLFQTNQQLDAAAQRKLKIVASEDVGSPITVTSKILDVQVIWPNAWTAESGWLARHLDLEVGTFLMDSDGQYDADDRLARLNGCIKVTRDL
jgi:hypothetical protein